MLERSVIGKHAVVEGDTSHRAELPPPVTGAAERHTVLQPTFVHNDPHNDLHTSLHLRIHINQASQISHTPHQYVLVQVGIARIHPPDTSSKTDAAVQNFYPVTTYDKGYSALTDKDTEVGHRVSISLTHSGDVRPTRASEPRHKSGILSSVTDP